MEFKAKLINGVLEIYPKIIKIPNAQGGTDVKVHMLNPVAIEQAKAIILNKMARGEPVKELEV